MKERDILWYQRQFPQLQKWLNQCPCSGSIGLKPEMPEPIGAEGSVAGEQLRRMLRPMAVDEAELCEVCRRAINGR